VLAEPAVKRDDLIGSDGAHGLSTEGGTLLFPWLLAHLSGPFLDSSISSGPFDGKHTSRWRRPDIRIFPSFRFQKPDRGSPVRLIDPKRKGVTVETLLHGGKKKEVNR
jgi:hypothetical protein